jgi:hypothetical protein
MNETTRRYVAAITEAGYSHETEVVDTGGNCSAISTLMRAGITSGGLPVEVLVTDDAQAPEDPASCWLGAYHRDVLIDECESNLADIAARLRSLRLTGRF